VAGALAVFMFFMTCAMILFPSLYDVRYYWIPAYEEVAKTAVILAIGFVRRVEFVWVGAIYGYLEGLGKLYHNREMWDKYFASPDYADWEVHVVQFAVTSIAVVGHALFALLYLDRARVSVWLFWIPPLVAHYAWNAAALTFVVPLQSQI
jgi:hypothetical protein